MASSPVCLLCRRKFVSEDHLERHKSQSKLHAHNLLQRSRKLVVPKQQAENKIRPKEVDTIKTVKRLREESQLETREARSKKAAKMATGVLSSLKQIEQLLAAQAREKEIVLPVISRKQSGPHHRNGVWVPAPKPQQSKETRSIRSMVGGSIRKAREINGNLDWKCSACRQTNFARTVICMSCGHCVDQHTEYMDGSQKQKKRYEIMMRLANARK